MGKQPRTRLEQLVSRQGLGTTDFQREFARRAQALGIAVDVSRSAAKRWFQGGSGPPRLPARQVLESWFGEPAAVLFGSPLDESQPALVSEQELAMTAAHESVSHAIEAASVLDPSAIEHLYAAAAKAANDYYITEPLALMSDLVPLRNTIYHQLDRTHKPLQQAELYLLAGQVCGLLSCVAWDLGLEEPAQEQARAAFTYGCIIDHPSLQAWARALQVTMAFWSGYPRRASRIATAALATAPAGTARARLHAVNARALALLHAPADVHAALQAAADELDRAGGDEFLDDIGGELAFDRPRRGLCAGAAYVALGDGEQAEHEALQAVALFEAIPLGRRWTAGVIGAHVDLGAARALRDDLAGASEALRPVFDLPHTQRTEAITLRLHALARTLGTARYRGSVEAIGLSAHIEEYTAVSLPRTTQVRMLPPAT